MTELINKNRLFIIGLLVNVLLYILPLCAGAAVMNDYCNIPPYIAQSVPPLVMFEVGRDHKLYYSAYNDAADLDDDGQLDTTYKHSIDYYGYFDAYKCYTHSGGSGANDKFTPANYTANKFCSAGQWSGNVLNWMTMSRSDVLRKVLFGGHRSQDSNTYTELERVYVPQDAHSWGKELTGRLCFDGTTYTTTCVDAGDCNAGSSCVDKSVNLIGIAAADAPTECSSPVTVSWTSTNKTISNTTGNILVSKYKHPNHPVVCGDYSIVPGVPAYVGDPGPYEPTITDTIYGSYEASPANFIEYYYISDFNFADTIATHNPPGNFTMSPQDALPTKDHGMGADLNDFNFFAVSEFNVTNSTKGNWQFLVDGDDGVELIIDGQLVTFSGGCHHVCFTGTPPATIGATTTCSDGVTAAPLPGTINLLSGYHRLLVRHSENTGKDGMKVWYKKPGDANWTIFGSTLTLRAPAITSSNVCSIKSQYYIDTGSPVSGTAKRHLFCNTTLSDGGTPIVRLLKNKTNRIWEWSAKERPVCDTSLGTPTDLAVRVDVCNSTAGVESNCKNYSGTYKPTGLLQKYGEGDGTKVCSKTFAKTCTSDTDCGATEGLCIYKAPMYFGLMTGSYTKNQSGGVLRKNIGSVLDETNVNNGIFQTSENVQGNIIHTLDRLKITNYNYTGGSYSNCGWVETGPPAEGMCENWGNPIAEMMYESLRYFAGKRDSSGKFLPTPAFTYSASQDMGLNLSKPDWGYPKGSSTYTPYEIYPTCAKPFVLLLSDINPSYDTDQAPGSAFASYAEDAALPQLNVNVSTLANTIGSQEGITSNNWFIGQTASANDFVCTSKTVGNLSQIRGLCPEEPTKKGGYYAAALAYYGKTLFHANTGKPDVNTFAVALASPVADMKIKVGANQFITFVPVGKSLDGCLGVHENCAAKCTFNVDAQGRFTSSCPSDAFCPTNQIVNDFVQNVQYDASGNVIYAKFRINYEDSEQGADHDMDAIVSYEICTPASVNMSDTSCTEALTAGQLEVKLSSDYASGCIDQALGFVVSGTTADGLYLPVKDKDVPNTSKLATAPLSMPLVWQKIFTVTATGSTSGFLKNPLWYAAKWGGFVDTNGNNLPDLNAEWNKGGTGDPDNYFLAVNPLKLEQQLDTALNAILARVSSGTAASILSNSEGSGANILQAVFYPRKDFENQTSASWIGEMQNLWYYIDPFLKNSTIREDSVTDNQLWLMQDNVANFYFDSSTNQTLVRRYSDIDGDGSGDVLVDTVSPDDVKSLWRAGNLLWSRNLAASPRTIYTSLSASALVGFSTTNAASLQPYMQAATNTEAANIINYIHGNDTSIDGVTPSRSRTVSIGGTSGVWKLGDIVSSTPRIQSSFKLNSYNLLSPFGYEDSSYQQYIDSAGYKSRGMVYVGGNDGMLHAFKLGKLDTTESGDKKATLSNPDATTPLGFEKWAYIPRNTLPYLKYLPDPAYNHIYYVDGTSVLNDASINCSGSYWDCPKNVNSWRTVLVGSNGLGGASRITGDACTNCVKTPITDPADPTKGLGYSSYFALDVTAPESPSLLWEFSNPALGYATSGPSIVRISALTAGKPDKTKNGRWFAVFASGPTGPINTISHQFLGTSDQTLKIFVVDLKTGALLATKDTGITNAFAGSITNGAIDTDRQILNSPGNYQDDVVYIGYVKKASDGTWSDGGLLRLVTKENIDPNQWQVSTVIDNIGPVTSTVGKLVDLNNHNLWIYFGTGRYYYGTDDNSSQRSLFGIKEPCFKEQVSRAPAGIDTYNDIDESCTTSISKANLTDQSTGSLSVLNLLNDKGWFINLDPADSSFGAERSVTDPVAQPNGVVYFTTFKPTGDICGFGGNSYLWAVKYNTGYQPPPQVLKGKAVLQLSTGSFEEVDLSKAFTAREQRRTSAPMQGKPPSDSPVLITNANNKPVKRIIHIQER